jgi:hypothetical protein
MSDKMQNFKITLIAMTFYLMLSVTSMDVFRFLSATQGAEWDCRNSERQLPFAEWKESRRPQISVSIGNQETPYIQAYPTLFTHLDRVLVVIIFVTWH